jgi:cytochrome P450
VPVKQQVMERVVLPVGLRALQAVRNPMAMLLHPKTREDPYPTYAGVRRRGLVQAPILHTLMLADHAGVTEVLRDHTRFDHGSASSSDLLLEMDPPDHTRVRRLVGKAFTPRAIQSLDGWIGELARELVGKAAAGGTFDLVADVALPLPLAVICRMLGVPLADRDRFEQWGHQAAAGLDLELSTSSQERTAAALEQLSHYLEGLIADHRAEPRDDLLSELIAATDEGDRLSEPELVSTCVLLLVAGFETTVNLIGNGALALLRHPDELARLEGDRSLLPNAVEEMLRWDSPVQLTSRMVRADTVLESGVQVPGGREIIPLLGGANRDPAVFDDPDRFDITRANADRHVSFSTGIHHCLGAALARMEARAAFTALLDHGHLVAAGPAHRRETMVLRGLSHLPVRLV